MTMKSMKLPKRDMPEGPEPCDIHQPEYPYGLCLYLDDKVLKMLGLKSIKDFEIGEEIPIQAIGRVTGLSMREYEGSDPSQSVDIQLIKMDVSGQAPTIGDKLYGDSDG